MKMASHGAVLFSWVLVSLRMCDGQLFDTFMNETIAVCPGSSCQDSCFRTRDESHSCYCDELCKVYLDCCYDFWNLCKNETFVQPKHSDTLADRIECRSIDSDQCDDAIKIVNKCPDAYPDNVVKQNCKSTYLEYFFPVVGEKDFIYANKYCAQCSGEKSLNLVQFPATLKCPDDEDTVRLLANISSSDAQRWFKLQMTCQHKIIIPEKFINKVRFCSGTQDYAITCPYFDKRLFQSVAEFKAIRYSCLIYQGFVKSTYYPRDNQYLLFPVTYRNSHCAMCNGIYPSQHNVTCPHHKKRRRRQICNPGPGLAPGPSFTVLLDFGSDYTTSNVNSVLQCPEGHTLDLESKTCSISCPVGYFFSKGRCLAENKGDDSSFLYFSIDQAWDPNMKTLDHDKILDLLKANDLHNVTVNNVSINGQDFMEISQSRYNESKHLGESRKTLSFCLDIINETLLMNTLETRLVLVFTFTGQAQVECQAWETFEGEVALDSVTTNDVILYGVEELITRNDFLQFELNASIWIVNDTYLEGEWFAQLCGSRTLACPLVLVVDSYIELLNETHLYLSSGETINSLHFTRINDQVFVCEEVLSTPEMHSKPFFTIGLGDNRVHYYMTIVGLSLSVSGLVLTLGVYLVLEPLRTVPGKILMNLNFSLLFAQLLFLIGADKTQSHDLCLIIGTVEHYLWLVSFFWMNVISFDLAKTFATSNLQSHDDRGRSLLLRYIIYSWGLPAIHVTTCFLLDYFDVVPDETLTYMSKRACFLSGYDGMLYAFVLPLTVIMAVNLVCFAGVIIMLTKASSLEKKIQKNRIKTNQLFLSVKLIPITGLTWIFGVVATLGRVPILWHPFIVFNSLQGVFVFCAFVFNKRVTKMLKMKLSSVSRSSDGSGTTNTRF